MDVKTLHAKIGELKIFNTDQGSQFTATAFTEVLRRNEIAISMDGSVCLNSVFGLLSGGSAGVKPPRAAVAA